MDSGERLGPESLGGPAVSEIGSIDLRGVKSESEAVEKVREAAQRHKPGEWILGSAWDQNLWAGRQFPRSEVSICAASNRKAKRWRKFVRRRNGTSRVNGFWGALGTRISGRAGSFRDRKYRFARRQIGKRSGGESS